MDNKMIDDPLDLAEIPTPESVVRERAEPHPLVVQIYKRIIGAPADSLEMKVQLLAHLTFFLFKDLKEVRSHE
jgi:hypothetical protein